MLVDTLAFDREWFHLCKCRATREAVAGCARTSTTETPTMLFAMTLGRFTFELTRSDLLLKLGRREMYWNWYMRTGIIFEKLA
jgi:hypothetical protein